MNATTHPLFGEVIHVVTRAQLIEDGQLIDISKWTKEAGIKFPCAVSRAVWEDVINWTEQDTKAKPGYGQSIEGRAWDVAWMLRLAVRCGGERIQYKLSRIPRPGHGAKRLVTLKAICGPGDDMEPVITILEPTED
jgi:hypothetical protein